MHTFRFRMAQVMGLGLALASLVGLVSGCAPASTAAPGLGQDVGPTAEFATAAVKPREEVSPGEIPTRAASDCPGLDSQLLQVIQAPDPVEQARALQLRVEEDKIQVLIVLEGEDAGFLEELGAEVGTQSGSQVQAFVPVDRLCDLAQADGVLAIRMPARAFTQ